MFRVWSGFDRHGECLAHTRHSRCCAPGGAFQLAGEFAARRDCERRDVASAFSAVLEGERFAGCHPDACNEGLRARWPFAYRNRAEPVTQHVEIRRAGRKSSEMVTTGSSQKVEPRRY